MPKEITHWILAEKIFQGIAPDSPLKDVVRKHKNLYLMAAVIPDTPFYLLRSGGSERMRERGMAFHDPPEDSYRPLSALMPHHAPRVPDDVVALVLGVIAHIHADASFHPAIYYFTGGCEDKKEREIRHRSIEAHLDIFCSERFPLPRNRRCFSDLLRHSEVEKTRLANMLSLLFFGKERTNLPELEKALDSHAFIQKQFDKDWLKILLKAWNRLPGMDSELALSTFYPLVKPDSAALFPRPFSYRHPVTGRALSHSVRDLEEKAIREALGVFARVEEHMKKDSLSELFSCLKGPNLCTGMAGRQISDMRHFDRKGMSPRKRGWRKASCRL